MSLLSRASCRLLQDYIVLVLCVELNTLFGEGKASFTSELPTSEDRVLVAVVEAAAKNTFDFSNSDSLTVFSTGYNLQYWKPRSFI